LSSLAGSAGEQTWWAAWTECSRRAGTARRAAAPAARQPA
jgi:hypothetical protein